MDDFHEAADLMAALAAKVRWVLFYYLQRFAAKKSGGKLPTKLNKMNKQLNLFETVNEATNPACFLGAVGGSFVFKNGIENADFVVFNPLNIELKDEKPLMHEIKLKETDFWIEIKSMVWSSNCRFFFVVNENHIIIGNTHNNEAFLCNNLSFQVFEEFFKALGGRS